MLAPPRTDECTTKAKKKTLVEECLNMPQKAGIKQYVAMNKGVI